MSTVEQCRQVAEDLSALQRRMANAAVITFAEDETLTAAIDLLRDAAKFNEGTLAVFTALAERFEDEHDF